MSTQKLLNILEYLFPKSSSLSKKITDIKWVRSLTPIAPYFAISLTLCILIWGIFASDETKFIIKPHFVVLMNVAFWTATCLIVSAVLKKKGRSPAVPVLLALFFPLKGICVLTLFLGIQSTIKDAGNKLKQENAHFAQKVQSKIQEERTFITQKSKEKKSEVKAHQEEVHQSIANISHYFDGGFERLKATHEMIKKLMDERVAESEERIKAMDKVYWDTVHRRQEELEASNKSFFRKPQNETQRSAEENKPQS